MVRLVLYVRIYEVMDGICGEKRSSSFVTRRLFSARPNRFNLSSLLVNPALSRANVNMYISV